VRSGDSDHTFSRGRRVSPPQGMGGPDLNSSEVAAPRRNVGGFIGPGWGVDKGDKFPFVSPHV